MKEYIVVLEFNLKVTDVEKEKKLAEKQRKQAEIEKSRQEAVEIQRKRLAGIEEARRRRAAESKDGEGGV